MDSLTLLGVDALMEDDKDGVPSRVDGIDAEDSLIVDGVDGLGTKCSCAGKASCFLRDVMPLIASLRGTRARGCDERDADGICRRCRVHVLCQCL